jgi:uncharacterized protein YbaR (Trm112 family)
MKNNGSAELPISKELLDILRCPQAVQEKTKYGDDPGRLELVKNAWLVSKDSGLKYPIRDGIPVMLIDEGLKWKDVAAEDLPVPPPNPTPAPAATTSSSAPAQKERVIAFSPKVLAGIVLVFALLLFLRKRA